MPSIIETTDILEAKKRISSHIYQTPLWLSNYYSSKTNSRVYLKLENLQLTGSFKLRGGLNSMLRLSEKDRKKGIITASAGNHAQGIAFASKLLKIPARIVVPKNTPKTKISAIQSYGDTVNLEIKGEIYDEAEKYAIEYSNSFSIPYISPYNHPDVIAGQGTIGLELMEIIPDLDSVLIPLSGGGLFSGISIAVKSFNPSIRCYGIQLEVCPVMLESLRQGKIVDVEMKPSIAEGLHGGVEKNSITFPYIQKYCEEVLLVSEDEIKTSIVEFMEHHHLICEGAGAVGLAAVKRYKDKFKNQKVAIIISGANMDLSKIKKIFS